jgi:cytosolic 5'-nucleotidase 3
MSSSTQQTDLSAEGDSTRSTVSTFSADGEFHSPSHIAASAKLTDLKFLREHPQHSIHHLHHPPHSHLHTNDPQLAYHDKPEHSPLSHSPSDEDLTRASVSLFGGRVITPRPDMLKQKLELFRELGVDSLQVVSDFDFTISKFNVNGSRGASCHRILEDCGLLSHDYHQQAQAIQRKYYPMEVDPNMDEETRVKFMIEWVERAHELLQASHLTNEIITQAVELGFQEKRFRLRDRVVDFFDVLKANDVPLLIFSAGIADVVEDVLQRTLQTQLDDYDITIISNRAIFEGPNNEICGFVPPVLHVFNKKAVTFLDKPFFQRLDTQRRENVLVLGDSLGDVTMTEGMNRSESHIIRVGFLNDRMERLPQYEEVYDIVVLDDPGFDVPINIVMSVAEALSTLTTVEENDDAEDNDLAAQQNLRF